jgi:putative transposase
MLWCVQNRTHPTPFYDENDLNTHIDYVHFNPMKHCMVKKVGDWPWSSFHRYVRMNVYPPGWGGSIKSDFLDMSMGE